MKVLLIVFCAIALYILAEYNIIVRQKNKVKQAKSTMDVYLTQRFDLIPNLVDCVKAYMKHEQHILEKVAELRGKYDLEKDLETGAKLNSICNTMVFLDEEYPELKSSEQFLNLQKNLSKIENQLQAARRLYNSEVTIYNTKITTVPTNIIAGFIGFKEEKLFQMEVGADKNIRLEL